MATLGQQMKNLRSKPQEHRVNVVEGNPRTVDPNDKKEDRMLHIFATITEQNGHTPSWCRKKIRDEELKRLMNERTANKKFTCTQDYSKKRGPNHGSEQWTRRQDFQRRNQNYNSDGFTRNSSLPGFLTKAKLCIWERPSKQQQVI